MTFAEELKSFKQTHRYSELVIGGIKTSYLLCGNSESEKTLVYLVGGTGFSAAWFKHIQLMEHEYRIVRVIIAQLLSFAVVIAVWLKRKSA